MPKRIIHLIDQIKIADGKWFTRVWSVEEEDDDDPIAEHRDSELKIMRNKQ